MAIDKHVPLGFGGALLVSCSVQAPMFGTLRVVRKSMTVSGQGAVTLPAALRGRPCVGPGGTITIYVRTGEWISGPVAPAESKRCTGILKNAPAGGEI
jgi:hypothetical protein